MPCGNGATSTRAESAGNAPATFAWGLSAACTRVSLSSTGQYIDPIEIEQGLSRRYTMLKKIGGPSL